MDDVVEYGVKIIAATPAIADAFPGGGHERSAKALADAIMQLSETDSAIGLEGDWGSGKSTVIKLAENVLGGHGEKPRWLIFTFDLWAHQSDDFRRAYLEEFANWAEAQHCLNSQASQKARDEIRDRVKEVRTENRKTYNFFGAVFLLLIPLYPLVYAWLGSTAIEKTGTALGGWQWHMPVAVMVIVLLYGVFFLRFIFQYLIRTKRWFRLKKPHPPFLHALSNAISMFSRDAEREVVKQNIRESDPTTIEFHSIFRRILQQIQEDGLRVVHILDNIDRLPEDSVPKVWSEVRALFAVRSTGNASRDSTVTVVLPYDKAFILKAFGMKPNCGSDLNVEVDFIEKTFDRTLRVAPPVSTDWENFLFSCLDKAFTPKISPDSSGRLFRLLRYYFQEKRLAPSPRRIISYVNDIGTLRAQWSDKIPIESIALYVLHRRKIEVETDTLQKPEFVADRYRNIVAVDDWRRDFAALAFNVEPTLANQVLLGGPISRSITAPSSSDLEELSKLEGFAAVLPDVLAEGLEGWAVEDASLVSRVAINVHAINLPSGLAMQVWKTIGRSVRKIETINTEKPEVMEGFCVTVEALRSSPDAMLTARHLREVLGALKKNPPAEADLFGHGQQWFRAIDRLHRAVKTVASQDDFDAFITETQVPLDPDVCLGAAYSSFENSSIPFNKLVIRTPDSELDSAFARALDKSPRIAGVVFSQVSKRFTNEGRLAALKQVDSKLRSTPVGGNDDLVSLINLLLNIYETQSGDEAVKAVLAALVSDGTLSWVSFQGKEIKGGDDNILSDSLWLIIRSQNSTQPPNVPESHPQLGALGDARTWFQDVISEEPVRREGVVSMLASYVARFGGFQRWMAYASEANANSGFFKAVFRAVVKAGQFTSLNIKATVIGYPKIRPLIDAEDLPRFFTKLGQWEARFADNFTEIRSLEVPISFIEDIYASGRGTPLMKIIDSVKKYLKSLSEAEWESVLTEESGPLKSLIALHKADGYTLPANLFSPALLAHALMVFQGKIKPKVYAEQWDDVTRVLKPTARKALAKDIFNKLDSVVSTNDGLVAFLTYYDSIAAEIDFSGNPDVALEQFLSKLVCLPSEVAKAFVDRRRDVIFDLLASASSNAKQTIEDAIQTLESRGDEATDGWARALRVAWRLEARKEGDAVEREDT